MSHHNRCWLDNDHLPPCRDPKGLELVNPSERTDLRPDQIIELQDTFGSKATTENPKDVAAAQKVSPTKVPAVAVYECARAMMDGARKYGPFNWRSKDVVAHIYVDAAKRHLDAWFEGQEYADDSHVHHLGHAMACCAILIDALKVGALKDDRPTRGCGGMVSQGLVDLHQHVLLEPTKLGIPCPHDPMCPSATVCLGKERGR